MARMQPDGVGYERQDVPSKCDAPPQVPAQTSFGATAATAVGASTGARDQSRPSKWSSTAPFAGPPGGPQLSIGKAALETQTSSGAVPESTPSGAVVPLSTADHDRPS
jgi:hypothetical protein